MALRLIEVVAPGADFSELQETIGDDGTVECWKVGETDDGVVARLLVRQSHAESVTDRLRDHFEGREGFRLVLVQVEASIPPVEEKEVAGSDAPDPEDEKGKRLPNRVSREELYQELSEAAKPTRVYLASVALSTLVAAVGLMRGDVAVIIGAMVIAPLLGPNVALSLASTLGDIDLAGRAAKATGAGLLISLVVSALVGLIFGVDPTVNEIASRVTVGYDDLAVALAAGGAGALAYTSGLPSAVIGVMVAIALLPPTAAAGILAGAGEWSMAGGAALLVLANVTCLNLAAVATFLIQRVRPRGWWEEEKAKKATRAAILSWCLMLAVLVVVIYLVGVES